MADPPTMEQASTAAQAPPSVFAKFKVYGRQAVVAIREFYSMKTIYQVGGGLLALVAVLTGVIMRCRASMSSVLLSCSASTLAGFLVGAGFVAVPMLRLRRSVKDLKRTLRSERAAVEELKKKVSADAEAVKRSINLDKALYEVLENERAMVVKLLHTMVPPRIADDLSRGIQVPPEMFRFVVVFFSDIEGFTAFGNSHTPLQVFAMLDGLFNILRRDVETIGDAYMVVAGILDAENGDEDEPNQRSINQGVARSMCEFAILVNASVQRFVTEDGNAIKIRIGIHDGPVVTGLTGSLTPRFCLFGDTVNTASRMESTGEATKIHMSGVLTDFIKHESNPYADQYLVVPRETETFVKGKGMMSTSYLMPAASRNIEEDYRAELAHVDKLCASAADKNKPDASAGGDEDGSGAGSKEDSFGPAPRFATFNLLLAPAAHHMSESERGSVSHEPGKRAGSQSSADLPDGYYAKSVSSMSGITNSTLFRHGSLTSKGNTATTGQSEETAELLKRFAALEAKFNDAMTARAFDDEEKQQAERLMVDNERKATELREKNAMVAQILKEKQKALAETKLAADVADVAELAKTDEAASLALKARVDSDASLILQKQMEQAMRLMERNSRKAASLEDRNRALARGLAQLQARVASDLEIDNSILDSKMQLEDQQEEDDIKAGGSTHFADDASADELTTSTGGSSGSAVERARRLKEKGVNSKARSAMTALVSAQIEMSRAHEAMLDEEEEEAEAMLRDADVDEEEIAAISTPSSSVRDDDSVSLGSHRSASTSSAARRAAEAAPDSKSVSSAADSRVSSIKSGAGASADTYGSKLRTRHNYDELSSGIVTYECDQLVDRDFDLLRVKISQPLAITRAIIVMIEGVVGDLSGEANVSQAVLCRFLWKVGNLYRDNPYHNYHHSMCVVQYTAILLRSFGAKDFLSPKEIFACLIAAAVHDIDHRGLTNAYLVNSGSKLAAQYNGESVLERHHIDTSLSVMKDGQCDLFARWATADKTKARDLMTRMILKTDMSCHNALTAMLEERATKAAPFDFSNFEHKASFCEAVLHAADASNAVRPFAISEVFATRLAIEFNKQTEREKEQNLPVAAFMVQPTMADVCRGENGFISFVARPYWVALGKCFPGKLDAELATMEGNIAKWKSLGEACAQGPFADETLPARLSRLLPQHFAPEGTTY